MELLHRPAPIRELAGQPVEQLGMRRRIGLRAEITTRAHEPCAEERPPRAVDRDAADERVALADEPPGEGQTISRLPFGKRREDLGDAGSHRFPRAQVLASMMAKGPARIVGGAFLKDHRDREGLVHSAGKG